MDYLYGVKKNCGLYSCARRIMQKKISKHIFSEKEVSVLDMYMIGS